MNFELVNNRISQLPLALSGIVHESGNNGISLSIEHHTVTQLAKRYLP